MLGAGPGHAPAPDLLLKRVLVELGATTPTRGLYLVDRAWDEPGLLEAWLAVARPQVTASGQISTTTLPRARPSVR
jgi:FMN reductase